MNIRKLNIFYATAINLNMSKVSRDLYISQPAISQVIKEIEAELGVNLFDRIGKKLYLTQEGEVYLNYVRRMLNLYEEAHDKINEMSYNNKGKIRIGASTTIGIYLLPDLIREFVEVHEEIEISLIIENTVKIEMLLLENKIDLAFIEGRLISDEIIKKPIWKDEIVFICSKKHELHDQKIVHAGSMRYQKFIMREVGSGTRKAIESYMEEHEIDYKIFMELGDNEAIKRCVEAGLGIGCISTLCISEERDTNRVCEFRLNTGKIERDLYLIYHKDKFMNNNMKEFMNFTYNQLLI